MLKQNSHTNNEKIITIKKNKSTKNKIVDEEEFNNLIEYTNNIDLNKKNELKVKKNNKSIKNDDEEIEKNETNKIIIEKKQQLYDLLINKNTKIINKTKNIDLDIMEIIDDEDKELLLNKRIQNMSRMDWAKTMAISNQYIHKNILQHKLSKFGYKIYTSDDNDFPKNIDIDKTNNSPGFDIIVINPDGKIYKIQSKLRQVRGNTDYSQQLHFETTRRNSEKNKDKNHTGQVCYSLDEFDYVMVSIINDKQNRDKIKNCNLWTYCIIPISDLKDEKHNCCVSHIESKIIEKNIIDLKKDIRNKFI